MPLDEVLEQIPISGFDDGMADGALMTIEEYLHTSFHPDCDYVDGEVQERLWGRVRSWQGNG